MYGADGGRPLGKYGDVYRMQCLFIPPHPQHMLMSLVVKCVVIHHTIILSHILGFLKAFGGSQPHF